MSRRPPHPTEAERLREAREAFDYDRGPRLLGGFVSHMNYRNRAKHLADAISIYVRGRSEVSLDEVKRHLFNHGFSREPLASDGRLIAKMLNDVGLCRDGWIGTGYDRSPRYSWTLRA